MKKREILRFRFDFDTERKKYILRETIMYWSERYRKYVIVEEGFESDGASGPASDIVSLSWWVHDKVCDTGTWADGTPISAGQTAMVLRDCLLLEGRWVRAISWPFWTFLWSVMKRKREEGREALAEDAENAEEEFATDEHG